MMTKLRALASESGSEGDEARDRLEKMRQKDVERKRLGRAKARQVFNDDRLRSCEE